MLEGDTCYKKNRGLGVSGICVLGSSAVYVLS